MSFQCPKGTRDFYPPDMYVRNWIADRWRSISHRNGFEEYDGPIFEYLDVFRIKSGDAIVGELFHFQDRGGREFAIRPEMTPTLARMVAARANALSKPIKWFSMPRLCRAERPQRGRLREFFQWNIDILGEESALADAECIFVLADFLRDVGLSPEHFEIRINSRELVANILENAGIAPDRFDAIYAVLDKRDKVDEQHFEKMVGELHLTQNQQSALLQLGEAKGAEGLARVEKLVLGHPAGEESLTQLRELFHLLDRMGIGECCRFDMGVVRGLAYYTGVVIEAFGKGGLQRAIAGGGRYGRLVKLMGGPDMSGIGFATSDVVIQDLLTEFNLLPEPETAADLFIIDDASDPACFDTVLEITTSLRQQNHSAIFSYKRQNIGKQFKQASARGVRRVVIVDDKTTQARTVSVKDMASGKQIDLPIDAFLDDPLRPIEEF